MHHDQCTNKIEKAKDAPAQRSVHRMARFSIIIPDDLSATVKARAEEEEVSLAEVGRRALSAWCTADAPDTTAEYTAEIERCTTAHQAATTARDEAIALVERGKADLVRLEAESERLREDLVRTTTTRDQFAERVIGNSSPVAVLERGAVPFVQERLFELIQHERLPALSRTLPCPSCRAGIFFAAGTLPI